MACKNCKPNRYNNYLGDKVSELQNYARKAQEKNWMEKNWDDSMGRMTKPEKLIVFFFAWVPLIIGYVTIVRFFISLF
tara:strand:- start:842 stop:1075 length:234 start_codon:yes stop_codon:yes gene_type:complete